jgi:hypothetical protein
MSVRLSAWNKWGSHYKNFNEIWYLISFRKSVQKIQVSLKSDNNNGEVREDHIYFWSHLTPFFLEWEMFQTKVAEKIKHTFYFQ